MYFYQNNVIVSVLVHVTALFKRSHRQRTSDRLLIVTPPYSRCCWSAMSLYHPDWKPPAHVDIAWDKSPSLRATSLIINPSFQAAKSPLLLLALMVVFSQTPSWFVAGGPCWNTVTEAELLSGLSETQRCCWSGRRWRTSYWKWFAQLAIALREFVFTPNTAWQRHWPGEKVCGCSQGLLAESVLWLEVGDTVYPRRFMGCVA